MAARIQELAQHANSGMAAGTVSGVLVDLVTVERQLVGGADPGKTAGMLERLSQELGEAAQMIRAKDST